MDIAELFAKIENTRLCEGLIGDDAFAVATNPTENPDPNPNTIVWHTVTKAIEVEEPHFEVTLSLRAVACEVLVDNESDKNMCKACTSASNAVKRSARKKSKASATPAKPKASLTACGPEKLQATVKSTRLQVKDPEDRLQELQCKVKEQGMGISESLGKDILKIMGGRNSSYEVFLQEQMNLPKAGINNENVQSLPAKVSSFTSIQRYAAVVMNEMKIQSNLVFDKVSGELIGFVGLGDPMTNFATLTDEDQIATHALAFLVRGLCTDLKHIIAYFFTGNVTSFQIMPVFWRTVAVLEVSLNLHVCAAVNDGASPNRKFFRLHSKLSQGLDCDIV